MPVKSTGLKKDIMFDSTCHTTIVELPTYIQPKVHQKDY
jgi:hypothetical protein